MSSLPAATSLSPASARAGRFWLSLPCVMPGQPPVVAAVAAAAAAAVLFVSCHCCSCVCCCCCNMLANACMSVAITAASGGVDGSPCCDLREASSLGIFTVLNHEITLLSPNVAGPPSGMGFVIGIKQTNRFTNLKRPYTSTSSG